MESHTLIRRPEKEVIRTRPREEGAPRNLSIPWSSSMDKTRLIWERPAPSKLQWLRISSRMAACVRSVRCLNSLCVMCRAWTASAADCMARVAVSAPRAAPNHIISINLCNYSQSLYLIVIYVLSHYEVLYAPAVCNLYVGARLIVLCQALV